MILLIGDTSSQLADYADKIFGGGQLIDNSNFLSTTNSVYFTALGDLTFDQIKILALAARQVYFIEDLPWSDKEALVSTYILCNHLSQFITVHGVNKQSVERFLTVPVTRDYTEPTMWTFGCSHTKGVGLDFPEQQVYGKLLADKLGMKWQNIARDGSSTRWSLAHLLNADIQTNDVVIWATTSIERIRIASDSINELLLSSGGNKAAVMYYNDKQLVFDHLDYINTGVRYLQRSGINFILLSLLSNNACRTQIELHCSHYKEWCPVENWTQHDKGNDNLHIGPIGHITLAERIYNHVQLLEYDKFI